MQNSTILLIAHGSRREASNDEIKQLAVELETRLKRNVMACFLEIATPSIEEAIAILAKTETSVTVLPYFLSTGRHVAEDIPRILGSCKELHPELMINMLAYMGKDFALLDILIEQCSPTS